MFLECFTSIAEDMGSNHVEALKIFSEALFSTPFHNFHSLWADYHLI